MVEQERLELTSAVEAENHDKLDDLAKSLEDVDTALRDAGSDSSDEVKINVDVEGIGDTLTQLEALEDRLDSIEDHDISFGGTTVPEPETPGDGGDTDPGTAMTSGGIRRYDEIDPDAFTPAGVEIGGFSTPNAVDDERSRELMVVLDGDEEQFSPFDVGQHDGSDTIQMERNTGLAAEGLGGELGAEIIEAQREAMEMRDDETLLESLDGAEKEFKDIRFTMGQFHDIIAALIPLAGVFIGAMPAAITSIVALGGAALAAAGALAGIGALGAMGLSLQQSGELSMEPLNEMFNDVGGAFVDAFAPLSMTFAPLIRDAATELETLMGPLATAASGLQMFTDEFSAVTRLAGNALPSIVSMSLRFADAVMPVLAGIGQFLVQKDIFGFMANQLATALPQLIQLGVSFAQILPAIIRISQGFLVFATAIIFAVDAMSRVINAIGILGPIIGGLISLYLGLITASTIYSIVTANAISAIVRFAAALVVKLAPAIAKGITFLTGYTLTTWQAYAATVALIGALTLGVGAVAAMSGGFAALNSNIGDATKNLRNFAKTSNGIGSTNLGASGSGFGSGSRSGFYQDNSTTVIQAGDRDSAARQQYASEHERQQHLDSVFGS